MTAHKWMQANPWTIRLLVAILGCAAVVCGWALSGPDRAAVAQDADAEVPAEEAEAAVEAARKERLWEDPDWLITVEQDESATEEKIADYLHEWDLSFERVTLPEDEDDLMVAVPIAGLGGAPDLRVMVDTQPTRHEGEEVAERAVKVWFWHALPDSAKTQEARKIILEHNNQWMVRKWMPHRVIIDPDGDIAFEVFLNIPGRGVPFHPELVRDAIIRCASAWSNYWPPLAEKLDL